MTVATDASYTTTRDLTDGRSRPPHLRSWSDGWRHLRFLLLFSPRWLFFYPGFVLIFLGVAVGARLIGGQWDIGPVVLDVNTLLMCAAFALIGYQSIWFGVLSKAFASREGLSLIVREKSGLVGSGIVG